METIMKTMTVHLVPSLGGFLGFLALAYAGEQGLIIQHGRQYQLV